MTQQQKDTSEIRLLLTGDVMLGRLVDQWLPWPVTGDEQAADDQRAARQWRPSPGRMQDLSLPWGDALSTWFARSRSDLRLINLETSITRADSSHAWPDKTFHYRVSPENAATLKLANIDFCNLANNHVLDFGLRGLHDTMATLDHMQIKHAGAGFNLSEARQPAVFPVAGGQRRLGCVGLSDHPADWAATTKRPGIHLLDYSTLDADTLRDYLTAVRKSLQLDMLIVSVHWGPNWRWRPAQDIQDMAHFLVDECGVDLIHGTSSHNVQGIEVRRNKLILYGCGDCVDDYAVRAKYRNDLGLLYLPTFRFSGSNLDLTSLQLVPIHNDLGTIRSAQALDEDDWQWLFRHMLMQCAPFGTSLVPLSDKTMQLVWQRGGEDKRGSTMSVIVI